MKPIHSFIGFSWSVLLLGAGCSSNDSTKTTTGPTRMDSVATVAIDSITTLSQDSASFSTKPDGLTK